MSPGVQDLTFCYAMSKQPINNLQKKRKREEKDISRELQALKAQVSKFVVVQFLDVEMTGTCLKKYSNKGFVVLSIVDKDIVNET